MRRLFAVGISLLAFTSARADDTIRVACVGDSITAGAGVEDGVKNHYPTVLQKLLGDKYEVKNFGVSGRTLLNKGDYPFTKEKKYKDALAFKPNVVVIKLGSNDAKPQNWKYADEYVADYKKLVASFQAIDSKPTVFLCTPAPAYKGNFGITEPVIKGEVKPKVEALAKELNLPLIDLYAALSDKPEMFPDQIHPNAAGAKVMAEAVAKAIRADAKK